MTDEHALGAQGDATLREDALRFLWHHFPRGRLPEEHTLRVIVAASGCRVTDDQGKVYLDAAAGMYTSQCGHGRPEVIAAMIDQAQALDFYPLSGYSHPPAIRLARKLIDVTDGNFAKVFLVSGGSEAIEAAIKVCRQHFSLRGRPSKHKLVSLTGGYHGSTTGALSISGSGVKTHFEPLQPGTVLAPAPYCFRCPYDEQFPGCGLRCADHLRAILAAEDPDTVAAVVVSPVINSLGAVVPPPGYFDHIAEVCKANDVLLVFDEMVTGFGRLGTMFGYEYFGVRPDVLCLSKGMSGGYQPCGAVLVTTGVAEVFSERSENAFAHGHTFGGHPIACAAALASIELVQKERLPERAAELGVRLGVRLRELTDLGLVADIRGIGLLFAIEFDTRALQNAALPVEALVERACYERGLIVRAQRGHIVIAPPLTISVEELDEICDTVTNAIASVGGG